MVISFPRTPLRQNGSDQHSTTDNWRPTRDRFRADSGTSLIEQGENVKGRPSGLVAQLAECSHGKREALGSSPGRATIFSSPVTFGGSVWVRGWGNEHQNVHVSLFLRCSEQNRGPFDLQSSTLPRRYKSRLVPQGSTSVLYT